VANDCDFGDIFKWLNEKMLKAKD